jgi:hypothetical protein
MACLSRAANRAKHPNVEPIGYTPDEFCAAVRISPSTYRRMKLLGLGPREMRLSKKMTRISPDAAGEWVRAREASANGRSDDVVA